ncbi:MAG: hypothetical protein FDZ70_07265, partial [Actinobacteria bacterium]
MADRPDATYSFGSPSASQVAAGKKRKLRTAAIIGGAVVVLVFSMAWNPPVGTVHKFTDKSDYNAEKESGCLNSGDGCHGTEKSYKDFNAYHPNAKCTTCHDYQGVGCIPCHSPNKNHECQLCHDGSMKGVADVVRLTDPYPKGHYRESTHTAMGTDMDAEVRAVEGGEAKATCGDCHSRDLRKSHTGVPVADGSTYGTDIGCGECHNDLTSFGQSEVKVDWKNDSCDDCHRVGAKTQQHPVKVASAIEATGAQTCGETGTGCHEGNDLHALHPDKPASCGGTPTAGEPGCHDFEVESHAPTATACGEAPGCHRAYRNDALTHSNDATVHSPGDAQAAADASYYGIACGACHYMAVDGHSLVDEHALSTSERTQNAADDCRNCHAHPASADAIADDWPDRTGAAPCESCHGVDGLASAHEGDFDAMHTSDSPGCSSSGPGCHPTDDLSQVGAPTTSANLHSTCLRCHDRSASGGNLAYDPAKKTCGSTRDCHGASGDYDGVSDVHDGRGGLANGTDADHHTAGTAQRGMLLYDGVGLVAVGCPTCHSMVLGVEHARPDNALASGSGTPCDRCHNSSGAPIGGANAAAVVKRSWPEKDTGAACAECHSESIHGGFDHKAEELDAAGTPVPGTCSGGGSGDGCHLSADLRSAHEGACTDCHKATGADVVRKEDSCGGTDPAKACHTGYTGLAGDAHRGDVHSPTNSVQASSTLYAGVPCGLCHDIRPNGSSLVTEHARTTSTMTVVPGDVCLNCHNATGGEVQSTIASGWATRDSEYACSSCHTLLHPPALDVTHDSDSDGCAATGGGCHPSADMSLIGTPTAAGNTHTTCLRCHDRTESDGNGTYDPAKKTCGSGRDCHGVAGQYDTSTSVHAGPSQTVDGTDTAHHVAGEAQRVATYTDTVTGIETPCYRCHQMALYKEHARPNSAINTGLPAPPNLCVRCHDGAPATMSAVKSDWPAKATDAACADCHGKAGVNAVHHSVETSHVAVERAPSGTITAGFCVRPGCHFSTDVRLQHEGYQPNGCMISLCHAATGDIRGRNRKSCGGVSGTATCHSGTSETTHTVRIGGVAVPVKHSAETTWVIGGVSYQTSQLGCFGCHPNDLRAIHSTALIGGSMEGGGVTSCAVCHEGATPHGAYALLPGVEAAIAAGDRRCIACHNSGDTSDGPTYVASAHKETTSTNPLPAGTVWSDPADDWKAGFDAMTGGGHNALPYQFTGASQGKAYPVTTFTVTVGNPGTYRWSLPPNSGTTRWLDTTAYPSAVTTAAIQALTVKCTDCHVFSGAP